MNHWLIAPILLPLCTALLLLFVSRGARSRQRLIAGISALLLVLVSVKLLISASDGAYRVYELGDWPAPFGIVLVLDRLSALMVVLTAVVAFFSLMYAAQGIDDSGRNFHVLFQLQLMGLNGAFLTGDLFNLFVFFEVLLIASYTLLLHGGGSPRLRAGFHYVVFNLAASALFLIAAGVLYGALGTLNMADLATAIAKAEPEQAAMARIGGMLLFVVFAAKAALLPLYFWLPKAYSAATAPVAALFAIMTKVGAYAIIRVYVLVFDGGSNDSSNLLQPWLLAVALATLALASIGVVAGRSVRTLAAYSVVVSVGVILAGFGVFNQAGFSAAIYYLVQSTLVLAALFLLADLLARQRPGHGDQLDYGVAVAQPGLLGALFTVAALAIVGLPPFSGFIGKLLVLQASGQHAHAAWVWTTVLLSGVLMLVAYTRAGSMLFWKTMPHEPKRHPQPARFLALLPSTGLLGLSLLLSVWAGPATRFADAAAQQLLQPDHYIGAVLQTGAPASPEQRP